MRRLQNLRRCRLLNLGLVEYGEAWGLQKEFFHVRSRNEIPDTLILLQHPPTYTFGRRSLFPLPFNPLSLRERDRVRVGSFSGEKDREEVSLYRVDRGGGATYHGPGQIVGYPILGLSSYTSDHHSYLRMLEEVIMRTLTDFDIKSQRINGYTGVWVMGHGSWVMGSENPPPLVGGGEGEGEQGFSDERKIASIGVRIIRGITMHGFALNVNNDLEPFNKIVPCNIEGVKMTSVSKILGTVLNIQDVEESLIRNFALIFDVKFKNVIHLTDSNRQGMLMFINK